MSEPRPTLGDIAARVGVSTATVSRVLNSKPGVKSATREAVQSAIDELGQPVVRSDRQALGLVAIVVPELSNPTFPAFCETIDGLLFSAGLRNVVCAAGTAGMSERQHLDMISELPVAGVISVSGMPADTLVSPEPYARLTESGIPTVFINSWTSELPGAYFSTDDSAAISSAVNHLRSLGHTRIGLATGPARYLPSQRKAAAFLSLGFDPSDISETIYAAEGGQIAASKLIDSGHTAVICGSDLMALGAIREAASRGLNIPGDLSVVGYDDSQLMPFTSPALTTIRQPIGPLAKAAVGAMVNALSGAALDPTEMMFHPDLIIRDSTGPIK